MFGVRIVCFSEFIDVLNFLEALPKKLFGIAEIICAIKSEIFEKKIRIAYEHAFIIYSIKSLEAENLITKQQVATISGVKNVVYEISNT